MNIDVIGVPLWEGSGVKGSEKGPEALINGGIVKVLTDAGHKVSGCVVLPRPESRGTSGESNMLYCGEVTECCKNIEKAVSDSMGRGNFPFILGGDHALAIGSVAGINHFIPADDLAVVWIDAHTDINTDATTETGHIHGMPVSACMGLGDSRLSDGFGKDKVKLKAENLYYIGSRCVDEPEKEILKKYGIRSYGMAEIRERGIETICTEILSKIKTSHIHLSFDVDFIGSEVFTATGLPIPDGPNVDQTIKCLGTLMADKRVSSADFVEYAPARDKDGAGIKTCMEVIKAGFERLS